MNLNVYGKIWEGKKTKRMKASEMSFKKERDTLGTVSLSSWKSFLEIKEFRAEERALDMYSLFTSERLH